MQVVIGKTSMRVLLAGCCRLNLHGDVGRSSRHPETATFAAQLAWLCPPCAMPLVARRGVSRPTLLVDCGLFENLANFGHKRIRESMLQARGAFTKSFFAVRCATFAILVRTCIAFAMCICACMALLASTWCKDCFSRTCCLLSACTSILSACCSVLMRHRGASAWHGGYKATSNHIPALLVLHIHRGQGLMLRVEQGEHLLPHSATPSNHDMQEGA